MQKTTSDNYVFEIIPNEKALEMFKNQTLFTLHEDGSKSLIETIEELEQSIAKDQEIGIEVGFLFI